jgi:hypothetical protein
MYTRGNKTDLEYPYYLSVLVIFKNEMMNMKTWVEHYLWQGVDHFYMLDNESTDQPLTYLQPYVDKGIVTYQYCPGKYNQVARYRDIYEKIKNDTKWLIICDLDEFFFGKTQNLAHTLDKETRSVLYCNWIMFGSSGLIKHPDDIRVSLIHRDPTLNKHTKYIIQTKYVNSNDLGVHTCDTKNDTMLRLLITFILIICTCIILKTAVMKTDNGIKIGLIALSIGLLFNILMFEPLISHMKHANDFISLHHYPIQSLDFFQRIKMTRGDVNLLKYENIRDMNYFRRYDTPCTNIDTTLSDLVKTYS